MERTGYRSIGGGSSLSIYSDLCEQIGCWPSIGENDYKGFRVCFGW